MIKTQVQRHSPIGPLLLTVVDRKRKSPIPGHDLYEPFQRSGLIADYSLAFHPLLRDPRTLDVFVEGQAGLPQELHWTVEVAGIDPKLDKLNPQMLLDGDATNRVAHLPSGYAAVKRRSNKR